MIICKPHETIKVLQQFVPNNPIIVEAGAFNGNDTVKMALQWPLATIHAFEPVPEIYERLSKNTSDFSIINCYPFGLSNRNGSELFYISERVNRPGMASQAGSLHKPKKRSIESPLIFPRTIQVNTITLDYWAHENNITHIDLLWLDTQGHEIEILKAAYCMLPKINVIVAEVSFIERYDGQPLYEEVVEWLSSHGFSYVGCDFDDIPATYFGNVFFVKNKNI